LFRHKNNKKKVSHWLAVHRNDDDDVDDDDDDDADYDVDDD
jgi:hypothetical protein